MAAGRLVAGHGGHFIKLTPPRPRLAPRWMQPAVPVIRGDAVAHSDLDEWFVNEVLPLEAALLRYLRRNWREDSELADLRQDVYVRVYEAAAVQRPLNVKAFVLATARNLLIDRARRAKIVSIEAVADLDALECGVDELTPERHVAARIELRLLDNAIRKLPARCREVVQLRCIGGLSHREVAAAMGISEDTVEKQLSKGVRAMATALLSNGISVLTSSVKATVRGRTGAA
jgi:RNA polymerase sigma-70 factor (ECF subfamily)